MSNTPAVIDLVIDVIGGDEETVAADIPLTIDLIGGSEEAVAAVINLTIDLIGGDEETVAADIELNIDLGSTPGNGGNGDGGEQSWIQSYWWVLAIIGIVLLGVGTYLLVRYWPERKV